MTRLLDFGVSPDAIGALKKAGNVQALVRLLGHRNFSRRWAAADALGTLGTVALVPCVAALESRDIKVRLGAVESLWQIRDPAAVPPLAEIVRSDPSAEVRWAGVLALGEIGDPLAIPCCVEALKDGNRYVRHGSAMTLGKLFWSPENDSAWAYYFIALQDWEAVKRLGKAASGPLLEMLKEDNPSVRIKIIDLLGSTGAPDAPDGCAVALKDRRDSVRYMAMLSAVKCGLAAERLPLLLARREQKGPNPAAAALLNFLFLGIGYNYIGKWWGFPLFMSYMTIILLAQLQTGPFLPYLVAYPVTALFAVQTYYAARRMADT